MQSAEPSSSPTGPAPGPAPREPRASPWITYQRLALPGPVVFFGAFLAAYGLYPSLDLRFVLVGALLLVAGLGLFAWEGRWSRSLIHPGSSPPLPPGARPPWWKRPISYHGRWLCTSCGWREEERSTFCPRCGKVLVRLPGPPEVKA